jgi:hypothetical protein
MTAIAKLQRVQNMAAKIITKTKKRDHVTPVLKSLHWLPVQYRVQFKILLLTFRCIRGIAPIYLRELLSVRNPTRSLRSSTSLELILPKSRLKSAGDRSFSYQAAYLWNQLPSDIRDIHELTAFKSALKTLLFRKAFSMNT